MYRFRKFFAALLTAVLLLSAAAPAAFAADDAFVPVLRFIASSDSHVRATDNMTADRIRRMMSMTYDIAEADPSYNALDALLIVGDLTNDGTEDEFRNFWSAVSDSLRGDTRYLGVVAKNHDGYEMNHKKLRGYYTSLTGVNADFHEVIGGYHFIGVSVSPMSGQHYDAQQLSWLRQQLDAATAEDPSKPVFVIHHEHNRNTVYGSSSFDGWGVTYFNSILKQYPQVVDFSGHSHYPLNDPRSIWQGDFTAVGTGAIYYSEFTVDRTRTYHPADAYSTATYWIVEVDANNRIRLQGMDIEAGERLVEYVLDNPADPANRSYTPAKRRASASAPAFDSGAEITAAPDVGACTVTVSAAASTDGMPVVLYRAKAFDAHGMLVAETWTLPQYYRAVEQPTVDLRLEKLSAGSYQIEVVAENAYGDDSEPLTVSCVVDDGGCPYCNKAHEGFGGAIVAFFHRIAYMFQRIWALLPKIES